MFSPDFQLLWSAQHHWPSQRHMVYEPIDAAVLWLVRVGRMQVQLDQTQFEIGAGQAFLQLPGARRDLLALEESQWSSVAMRVPCAWPKQSMGIVWVPSQDELTLLQSVSDQILAQHNAPEMAAQWKTEGAARWLLGLCFEHAPPLANQPLWLQKALEILHRQPQTELGVVAAQVGYSPTQFRTRFRHKAGMTPRDYAAECLAARARQLVSESDWPIEHIAHELGFAAATQFCRFFKRRFGMSPTQFRGRMS
jgi:AraC-like DNA-binding protein